MFTLRVDPDEALWLGVPDAWPFEEWPSPERWAEDVAVQLAPDHSEDAAILRDAFLALALSRLDFPADRTFAFYRDLELPLSTVDLAIFPAVGDSAERHRFLGRVDDPGAIGAVQVDVFATPGLGEGTRVVRFDPAGAGGRQTIIATLRYFWRVDEYDVAVNATFPGPTRLLELAPAVEDMLATLAVSDT